MLKQKTISLPTPPSFDMKIYTITLNPAYDIHAYTEHFEPYHENLANILSREAGGKGVNISRALTSCGTDNTAIIVVGEENCADFIADIEAAGIRTVIFEKEGRIRENLTLHTSDSNETRISFTGFSLDDSILGEIAEKISPDKDTVITFTGRVPSGISIDAVKVFLADLSSKGAKVVIDSRSFSLGDIYDVSPWLIKPNQEEISEYFGRDITGIDDAADCAKELASHGIENVMISLGKDGAILFCNDNLCVAKPPKIDAISTIGAGDSSIAGFISAYAEGNTPSDRLRTAVSFGSAACLTEGTLPPKAEDVKAIYEKIIIT